MPVKKKLKSCVTFDISLRKLPGVDCVATYTGRSKNKNAVRYISKIK